MVVCHCTVCRTWSASPVNGATIFKPENVRIVQGKDKLKSFAKNPGHDRSWCESYGGHVLDRSHQFLLIFRCLFLHFEGPRVQADCSFQL
ncbi:MAG: GFA family protein [SAR324 cluster bacterium]|nr:GFA family protein [SAR324 cluster bacterium]